MSYAALHLDGWQRQLQTDKESGFYDPYADVDDLAVYRRDPLDECPSAPAGASEKTPEVAA